MLHVSDDERRRRLAVRHALAPGDRVASPEDATRAMTVLHATDPATVYLSCWARCGSVTVADVERARYDERSLVKQLAMRRPWVALLPVLDPSIMGWKERGFYLGPHREQLFDRAGNAGTTAWVDGRIVGSWVQDDEGVVSVRLLEPVPAAAREALDEEARRLTAWLDGERINSVIRPPAMQAAPSAG